MSILSEFFSDARFVFRFRSKLMQRQRSLDLLAPKKGDVAPDFTLFDISGTESVTLSDFRGNKPVALIFGSYT